MRVTSLIVLALALFGCGPHAHDDAGAPDAASFVSLEQAEVEVACGECQFGMQGDGCNLAMRHGTLTYFLDGTSIDDHGDAHAADGFCNAVRKAVVSGEVVDGRFAVSAFALQP